MINYFRAELCHFLTPNKKPRKAQPDADPAGLNRLTANFTLSKVSGFTLISEILPEQCDFVWMAQVTD